MLAVVICDEYDCPEAIQDLDDSLRKEEIYLIKENDSFFSKNPQISEPFLFYRNPYIRIKRPKELLEFHKINNFNVLSQEKEIVSLRKDFFTEAPLPFTLTGDDYVSFYKPKIEPTPIIIFGNQRVDYLKFSLNSIKYSLLPDDDTPILLGMSAATKEYREICFKFKEENKNVTLYETKENSALAMINLILQDYSPEGFIILEDDFILPQVCRYVYPYWTRQYTQRLKSYEVVSLLVDPYNTPNDFFNMFKNFNVPEVKYLHRANWFYNKTHLPAIGSGMGMKTETYKRISNKTGHVTLGDGLIKNNCQSICHMQLAGYHIGWNQEMDGCKKLTDFSRFTERKEEYSLINHNNNYEKTYKLKDIL